MYSIMCGGYNMKCAINKQLKFGKNTIEDTMIKANPLFLFDAILGCSYFSCRQGIVVRLLYRLSNIRKVISTVTN